MFSEESVTSTRTIDHLISNKKIEYIYVLFIKIYNNNLTKLLY